MTPLLITLLACTTLAPQGPGDGPGTSDTDATLTDPTSSTTDPTDFEPFAPAPATLHRLTDTQFRNATEDLLGIRYDGDLPVDYSLHGYRSVGAAELGISPVEFEEYEAASWVLAEAAFPDVAAVEAFLGAPYHRDEVAAVLPGILRKAWRRPAEPDELDRLLLLADELEPAHGEVIAMQGLTAALLQAPDFLFRVEVGTADATDPDLRWLDDYELAARLAFFLTDRPPDDELLDAAERGELTSGNGLEEQAERLLATNDARTALSHWFDETLELEKIDELDKDATLYPELADLLPDMHAEISELFEKTAYDADADLTELLTTSTAYASPALAEAIYGVESAGGAFPLPPSQERGGVLGRAGILAVGAHNTVTSPTHRGKLVRTRLLCGSVPPPPPGVVTEISDADEGSLRDKLEQHATDPQCKGCHDMMDPIGFGLERFDPIGRWRADDNGYAIDTTGEVDGLTFDGGTALGEAIAQHPDFPGCMAAQLYRHAVGHAELASELGTLADITDSYVADGRRLSALVRAIVASEAFLVVGEPEVEPCADGATVTCETDCGTGVDTCVNGLWTGCDAPEPELEDCNGLDDDCDGEIDEALTQVCTTSWGTGEQACLNGAWSTECIGAEAPLETCNGLDDDGDGYVDEDLQIDVAPVTHADITTAHYACDPAVSAWNGPCNAAVHRLCGDLGCGVTGFGPVNLAGDEVSCLDSSEAEVIGGSFTALSGQHPDCSSTNTHGGPCNAAISRDCASRGLTTGYGPVENSGDTAVYVCTPEADVLNATYTELLTYEPTCDGATERWGWYCSTAIHEWCIDQGYTTGHGPLENSGDLAVVACLGAN